MTTTPASLTLRLLTMAGTAARLGLERVLTLAGIRTGGLELNWGGANGGAPPPRRRRRSGVESAQYAGAATGSSGVRAGAAATGASHEEAARGVGSSRSSRGNWPCYSSTRYSVASGWNSCLNPRSALSRGCHGKASRDTPRGVRADGCRQSALHQPAERPICFRAASSTGY